MQTLVDCVQTMLLELNFGWYFATTQQERDEWLELNKLFQEDMSINDTGGRETGMFLAGMLTPGGIFKNGVRSWIIKEK
ncbi:MAG: hypothetical protein N3I35_00830 [Clostridia bacterium]|nr:hypothetical protein [Clostridia bacterium]